MVGLESSLRRHSVGAFSRLAWSCRCRWANWWSFYISLGILCHVLLWCLILWVPLGRNASIIRGIILFLDLFDCHVDAIELIHKRLFFCFQSLELLIFWLFCLSDLLMLFSLFKLDSLLVLLLVVGQTYDSVLNLVFLLKAGLIPNHRLTEGCLVALHHASVLLWCASGLVATWGTSWLLSLAKRKCLKTLDKPHEVPSSPTSS